MPGEYEVHCVNQMQKAQFTSSLAKWIALSALDTSLLRTTVIKMVTMGDRIKAQRRALRLTQADLAKLVGVSLRQLQNWESNQSRPNSDKIRSIAKSLNKPISWVIGSEETQDEVEDTVDLSKLPKPARMVLQHFLDSFRARTSKYPPGTTAGEFRDSERSLNAMLDTILDKLAPYKNGPARIIGVANADTQEGRIYDADSHEANRVIELASDDPRSIIMRGDSGGDMARDGQEVVIDATSTHVGIGEPCVILTKDGTLRLKRKRKGEGLTARYDSINPAYPAFEVPARDVVAEFPVLAVLIKTREIETLSTVLEATPDKQPSKPAQNKRARPKK